MNNAIKYIIDGYETRKIAAEEAIILIKACLFDDPLLKSPPRARSGGKKDAHSPEFPPIELVDPDRKIRDFELARRSFNALDSAGVKTTRDLYNLKPWELLNIPNFGLKALKEVSKVLHLEAGENKEASR